MKATKVVHLIKHIQSINPNLRLCGSAALILAGVLEERSVGDLDFALNSRDFKLSMGIFHDLHKDYYANQSNDKYKSFHATYWRAGESVVVNLLVFNDDIVLDKSTVKYSDTDIIIQEIDTILKWKKKYNRIKDIKDLDNIANVSLENILTE